MRRVSFIAADEDRLRTQVKLTILRHNFFKEENHV
jgi:hypothetical protein